MFDKKKQTFLFRKKLNFFLKPILIISFIFIIYQLIMFIQLTKSPEKTEKVTENSFILGVHVLQKELYKPDQNRFTCIGSMEIINAKYVNDNYCDCLDGSDEPGTNACSNGHFYCTKQIDYLNFPKLISSSKVNDGICDCCDGSDEWSPKQLSFRLSDEVQTKLGRYQSPCPVLC